MRALLGLTSLLFGSLLGGAVGSLVHVALAGPPHCPRFVGFLNAPQGCAADSVALQLSALSGAVVGVALCGLLAFRFVRSLDR